MVKLKCKKAKRVAAGGSFAGAAFNLASFQRPLVCGARDRDARAK